LGDIRADFYGSDDLPVTQPRVAEDHRALTPTREKTLTGLILPLFTDRLLRESAVYSTPKVRAIFWGPT